MSTTRIRRLIFWACGLIGLFILIFKCRETTIGLGDFQGFWTSGRALTLGLDPYSTQVVDTLSPTNQIVPFWSPIYFAELMEPLSLFPVHLAKLMWTLLNLALSIAIMVIILKVCKLNPTAKLLVIGFMVLLSFDPFIFALGNGQTDFLVVFAVMLSWFLLKNGRSFWAGLAVCIGAVNPHLILGIALYYTYRSIFHKQWTLLLGGATGAALLGVISLPHLAYLEEWISVILPKVQSWALNNPNQITVVNILYRLLALSGPYRSHTVQSLSSITTIGFTLGVLSWCATTWYKNKEGRLELDIATSTMLTLVTTTYAFNQDYLLLITVFPYLNKLCKRSVPMKRLAPLLMSQSVLFSGMDGVLIPPAHVIISFLVPYITILMLTTMFGPNQLKRLWPWILTWILITVGCYALSIKVNSTIVEHIVILAGPLYFLFHNSRNSWFRQSGGLEVTAIS